MSQKQKRKPITAPRSVFYGPLFIHYRMDSKELWIKIIEKLMESLDRAQVITWFRNTAILSLKDGILTVGLPLPFFLNWHATHLAEPTRAAASGIDPSIKHVAYQVDIALQENDPRVIDLLKHFPESSTRKLPKKHEVKTSDGLVSRMFNPEYTLDNFITAPQNRLAHAACQNVAHYPGRNYNPLFIYGGVGLGKTHLLQATGMEMLKNDPKRTIIYSTTEDFVNEVVDAMQSRNMDHIRSKYRRVDALIIDDIQFIANKDRTQEEFFHTFNALYESGRQILISSDRPPHELTLLNERLLSRFESGMTVDVKMPDYETRLAILQRRCQKAQVLIGHEVLEFIAYNVTHSIRALEGVLNRAIADYELEHRSPTVKSVADIIRRSQKEVKMVGFMEKEPSPRAAVTIDRLIESVSDYYSITRSDITGESRVRECTMPRQLIMYLAKTKLKMSLAKIGRLLGNRNHTTVMHAINRIADLLKNDRQLLRDLNAITQEVGIHA